MPTTKDFSALNGFGWILLCSVIGIAGASLYARFQALRWATTLLVAAAFVSPALFLMHSKIVFPYRSGESTSFEGQSLSGGNPVFVLIFDELGTESLLDVTVCWMKNGSQTLLVSPTVRTGFATQQP